MVLKKLVKLHSSQKDNSYKFESPQSHVPWGLFLSRIEVCFYIKKIMGIIKIKGIKYINNYGGKMKKRLLFVIILLMSVILFSSCGKNESKEHYDYILLEDGSGYRAWWNGNGGTEGDLGKIAPPLTKYEGKDVLSYDAMFVEEYDRQEDIYRSKGYKKITRLDLTNFDTSKVKDMSGMFMYCTSLESINLSTFDTSNVENMNLMFGECNNLKSIDLSNFDTSNVKYMWNMFSTCSSLVELDVSNLDTSQVENMELMFSYCGNLKSLDLSRFDTSKVENMIGMFMDCINLETLDVSTFDTSNVENMELMFSYCSSLKLLDVKALPPPF